MGKKKLKLEDLEELKTLYGKVQKNWDRKSYINFKLNYDVMSILGFDTSEFKKLIPFYNEEFNIKEGVNE